MKKLLFGMAMMIATAMSCTQKPQGGQAEATDTVWAIRANCMVNVTPENRDTVIALSKELVDSSRKDEGNIAYDLYESATNPNTFIIFETWNSQAMLDKHSAAPHFKRLVPAIQNLSDMTIQVFENSKEIDSTQALRLNCMVTVSAENRDTVISLYKELVKCSQTDEGMIDYDLYLSTTDPTKMMVFESWKDQASLDKHSTSPHYGRLVPQIREKAKSTLDKFNLPKE